MLYYCLQPTMDSMSDIRECLAKQMCEYELLKSMYPEDEEIISDENLLQEIENFVDGRSDTVPCNLDLVINLVINKIKIEIFVTLPLLYPIEEPDICVRCNKLNRQQETSLNSQLMDHVKHTYSGEVCLYTVINWLQDNFDSFSTNNDIDCKQECDEMFDSEDKFARLWIYSHHIYSKKKREEIQKKCKALKLTGFCLPGKPGIICIEGHDRACQEWWRCIKSMCWKRIVIKKTETFELGDITELRKFVNFEELHYNKDNMSELSKFMHKRGFGEIFDELFGFDNK